MSDMEFVIKKSVIESILVSLQHFLERKDATQITSHISFEIDTPAVIKATDTEIGLSFTLDEIEIKKSGAFTANGKKLLDIVRILRDGDILFTLKDGIVNIRQGKSNFKLPIFDPKEFPEFPSIENKPNISIESQSLIKSFKKVTPVIDTNNPKHELNGALINITAEKTDIVATDTRRLAVSTIESPSSQELELILPKKAILEIQKLFLEQINIYYDPKTLIIKDDNRLFFTRLINGKFPNYVRIIPQNPRYYITLPTKEMINSIKMVTTISHDIKITFTPDMIIFKSLSTDNIEAKTELVVANSIEERLEISLNSRYLLDFLNQIESEEFIIGINNSTTPFVVEVEEENFITVIMPIII
jgi:DNA polymerase-3 subunit beta